MASGSVSIAVSAVKDAFSLQSSSVDLEVDEDALLELTFTKLQMSDASETDALYVTVVCTAGTLAFSSTPDWVELDTASGTEPSKIAFAGSVEGINKALAHMTYRSSPDWNSLTHGRDSITVTITHAPTASLMLNAVSNAAANVMIFASSS